MLLLNLCKTPSCASHVFSLELGNGKNSPMPDSDSHLSYPGRGVRCCIFISWLLDWFLSDNHLILLWWLFKLSWLTVSCSWLFQASIYARNWLIVFFFIKVYTQLFLRLLLLLLILFFKRMDGLKATKYSNIFNFFSWHVEMWESREICPEQRLADFPGVIQHILAHVLHFTTSWPAAAMQVINLQHGSCSFQKGFLWGQGSMCSSAVSFWCCIPKCSTKTIYIYENLCVNSTLFEVHTLVVKPAFCKILLWLLIHLRLLDAAKEARSCILQ